MAIVSCSFDDENNEFMFINEYETTVTVGGVVGIAERKFENEKIYSGTGKGDDVITFRIAEHSELN